jgi:FkbM family methyltransferase
MSFFSRFRTRLDTKVPPDPSSLPKTIGLTTCLQGLRRRGYSPQTVLDVGAAEGLWALEVLRTFPAAELFLVEALEERRPALEALRRNHPNLDYEIIGVGPRSAVLSMGITTALDASSFAYVGTAGTRDVAVRPLDSLLESGRFRQPCLLKLDVQGFELQVLDGAQTVLAGCDLAILELNFFRFSPAMPLLHEAIDYMVKRGFRPYEIVDVLRRPLDGAMGQCDLLFCREGHPLLADSAWQMFT